MIALWGIGASFKVLRGQRKRAAHPARVDCWRQLGQDSRGTCFSKLPFACKPFPTRVKGQFESAPPPRPNRDDCAATVGGGIKRGWMGLDAGPQYAPCSDRVSRMPPTSCFSWTVHVFEIKPFDDGGHFGGKDPAARRRLRRSCWWRRRLSCRLGSAWKDPSRLDASTGGGGAVILELLARAIASCCE
jgi:hypothetical protein